MFLDESAVLTNMARRYGRSPCGQRATAKVPFGHWKRPSVLSALGIEGVLASMSLEDATDGAAFAAYLSVLTGTDPHSLIEADPLGAQVFVLRSSSPHGQTGRHEPR